MNFKKMLISFKRKLFFEGVLKSFLISLSVSCMATFVFSLVYHILAKRTPVVPMLLIGGGVFLLFFVPVFFVKYYPTPMRVASRVDAMGLKERACTMLCNQETSGYMAELQRNDAAEHIKNTSSKNMRFSISKKSAVVAVLSVILAVVMFSLPHDILLFAEPKDELDLKQEQIIKDLIDEMREEVKKSQLDEELKDKINEIIDDLEDDLNKTDSELEQAGKIEDAKDKISDLLDKELTKNQIGAALQKYPLTNQLGSAISKGDTEKVSDALDDLEDRINNDKDLAEEFGDTIDKALEDSKVEKDNQLYQALENLSGSLNNLDKNSENFSSELKEILDKAENEINSALDKQNAIESEKKELEDILSDAKDELLQNKDEKNEAEKTGGGQDPGEGEEGQGDKPGEGNQSGDKPGGDKPGNKPGDKPGGDQPGGNQSDKDNGDGSSGGGDSSMTDGRTEGFYDPVSGEVSYGKVFEAYYSEYLKALKKGDVPEYLKKIMEDYFATLNE